MNCRYAIQLPLIVLILLMLPTGCREMARVYPGLGEIDPDLVAQSTAEPQPMTFPVEMNINRISIYQRATYRTELCSAIRLYHRVFGKYPDTMESFVKSGIPLSWPRNLLTGEPVIDIGSDILAADRSGFGRIKWEKFSDDYAKLSFIQLDENEFTSNGNEKWVINDVEFKYRKGSPPHMLDQKRKEIKAGLNPNDREMVVDIIGGTIPVNTVDSIEARMAYAGCGQLTMRACGASGWVLFHDNNFVIPSSFRDLYDERVFAITDNYSQLGELLKRIDADFKFGYDYKRLALYSWLKIDNEPLIAFARIHDPESLSGIGPQYLGIEEFDPHYFFYRLMANMSSPIITSGNMSQIEIPGEIAISIEDIPFGDDSGI